MSSPPTFLIKNSPVITDLGLDDTTYSIKVQADGKIVVVGVSFGSMLLDVGPVDSSFGVAHYNSDAGLTLAHHGSTEAEEMLGVQAGGTLALKNGTVTLDGTAVGTYQQSPGQLTILFGTATSTQVNSILHQLTYTNSTYTIQDAAGNDTFACTSALSANNIDTATDFSVTDDTIRRPKNLATAPATPGVLAAEAFKLIGSGSVADSTDHILYNTTSALGKRLARPMPTLWWRKASKTE
jgi:hypothetical protein